MSRLISLVRFNERRLQPFLNDEYPDAESLIRKLQEADPSNNKRYMQWIINQYVKKEFMIEDIPQVYEDLDIYMQHVNRFEHKYKDINIFTYSTLKEFLNQHFPSEVELSDMVEDGTIIKYRGVLGTLYVPQTVEASCNLGRGTRWCISSRKDNMFEKYNELGPIYIWYDALDGEKYAFHFETVQFMDARDNRIKGPILEDFRYNHPVIKQLFQHYEKSIINNPKLAYNYIIDLADYTGYVERWPEAEEIIMRDPKYAVLYARDILQERWELAEPYIMLSPYWSYRYAEEVLHNRWPEAEYVILSDEEAAIAYTFDVVQEPFPLVEHIMLKDPRLAYEYAHYNLRSRWPEAESIIMKDPEYAYFYAINVVHGRWLEAEPYIMKNPQYAYYYVTDVIRGPWPEAEKYIQEDPDIWKMYSSYIEQH